MNDARHIGLGKLDATSDLEFVSHKNFNPLLELSVSGFGAAQSQPSTL
jgi:hypothetical protein